MQKRDVIFDLLRTISLISAFAIHYHSKVYIGSLVTIFAFPTLFYSIGDLFFFVSGFMLFTKYYPKYLSAPSACTKYLLKKGFTLVIIYIVYIVVMYVLTNTAMPLSLWDFLIFHSFFSKVILTFGLLYILFPPFLFLFNYVKIIPYVLLTISAMLIVYGQCLDKETYCLQTFLLLKKDFGYPIIPSFFVVLCGFIVAKDLNLKWNKLILCSSFFMVTLHLFFNFKSSYYHELIANTQYFIFLEPIFIYSSWIIFKPFSGFLTQSRASRYFLFIGQDSLSFFMLFNMFISLCQITPDSSRLLRLMGLFFIFLLSYFFTYIHFSSIFCEKSMKRPVNQPKYRQDKKYGISQ